MLSWSSPSDTGRSSTRWRARVVVPDMPGSLRVATSRGESTTNPVLSTLAAEAAGEAVGRPCAAPAPAPAPAPPAPLDSAASSAFAQHSHDARCCSMAWRVDKVGAPRCFQRHVQTPLKSCSVTMTVEDNGWKHKLLGFINGHFTRHRSLSARATSVETTSITPAPQFATSKCPGRRTARTCDDPRGIATPSVRHTVIIKRHPSRPTSS